jgi:ATP-dependent Clp protease ATP-binding subunit ClpC
MWERFTERAKQIISAARGEAARLGNEYVQTEHILLALCRGPKGVAARALEGLDVDVRVLATRVELQAPRGTFTGTANRDEIVFTPRAKTVLQLAVEEARRLNCQHLGTEHMLLGLLREGEGGAARALRDMNIAPDRVEAEIARQQDNGKFIG